MVLPSSSLTCSTPVPGLTVDGFYSSVIVGQFFEEKRYEQ